MQPLKITALLLALLCTNSVFSQTKAETIEWLTETLNKSIAEFDSKHTEVKLESIDECTLVFSYKYKLQRYQSALPTAIKSLPDVGGFLPLGQNGRGFMYHNKSIHTKNLDTGKEFNHKYTASIKIQNPQNEENFYQKIEKALKHLATFCEGKK